MTSREITVFCHPAPVHCLLFRHAEYPEPGKQTVSLFHSEARPEEGGGKGREGICSCNFADCKAKFKKPCPRDGWSQRDTTTIWGRRDVWVPSSLLEGWYGKGGSTKTVAELLLWINPNLWSFSLLVLQFAQALNPLAHGKGTFCCFFKCLGFYCVQIYK